MPVKEGTQKYHRGTYTTHQSISLTLRVNLLARKNCTLWCAGSTRLFSGQPGQGQLPNSRNMEAIEMKNYREHTLQLTAHTLMNHFLHPCSGLYIQIRQAPAVTRETAQVLNPSYAAQKRLRYCQQYTSYLDGIARASILWTRTVCICIY